MSLAWLIWEEEDSLPRIVFDEPELNWTYFKVQQIAYTYII